MIRPRSASASRRTPARARTAVPGLGVRRARGLRRLRPRAPRADHRRRPAEGDGAERRIGVPVRGGYGGDAASATRRRPGARPVGRRAGRGRGVARARLPVAARPKPGAGVRCFVSPGFSQATERQSLPGSSSSRTIALSSSSPPAPGLDQTEIVHRVDPVDDRTEAPCRLRGVQVRRDGAVLLPLLDERHEPTEPGAIAAIDERAQLVVEAEARPDLVPERALLAERAVGVEAGQEGALQLGRPGVQSASARHRPTRSAAARREANALRRSSWRVEK